MKENSRGVDVDDIRADAHAKVCSRLCNHKGVDPAAAVGCRLCYTMVCEGGNHAIDKYYRKVGEEVWVNHRCWIQPVPIIVDDRGEILSAFINFLPAQKPSPVIWADTRMKFFLKRYRL